MGRSISLTAPGIHSAYQPHCIGRAEFILAVSNPVNRSIWRLVWKVPRPAAGFFIASFPRPNGGTTLFSPEATCFSSGRKNGFASGAPHMVIPCGRSSRWTSYGLSRRPGIRRAYKRTRGVRSPMRCAPFSRTSAWETTFGTPSRIISVNRFARFTLPANRSVVSYFFAPCWTLTPSLNVKCLRRARSMFAASPGIRQNSRSMIGDLAQP